MSSYQGESLLTIQEDGTIPETRMRDAADSQSFFKRLLENDNKRSWKRSRVNGLIDGNPPYKQSALMAAGRPDACNVNTGNGRAMLENSAGSFYDLFSEAPGYITVKTSYGSTDEQEIYSNQMSNNADLVLRECRIWDYNMQVSQGQTVAQGCGPFIFEDPFRCIPKVVLAGDLKVPERTPSDTELYEVCAVQVPYYPGQMYDFIRDEEAATRIGWDVEYTKKVIANSIDIRQNNGRLYDWEFYQQELKNNSLTYYDDSKVCYVAHLWWKEFTGRITHAIVERDISTGTTTPGGSDAGIKYLFISVGEFASFSEAIHPMYYDHGNGGTHHSVTGLGVKQFSLMEYQNRLFCNLCDKAFSPKILFKPTTTEVTQKFELTRLGDFAVLPPNFDWQQTGVAGLMNDGMAMHGLIDDTLGKSLSMYGQGIPEQKAGNPVTKFEKQMQIAAQAALNKTQYNRYYFQLDGLYKEILRRMCNLNSPDPEAKKFQDLCEKDGIPRECLGRISYCGATRVPGQGSAMLRKTAVDNLFPIAGSFPESGRANLIQDKIAVEAGQAAVARYFPQKGSVKPNWQSVMATLQIAAMKIGVPPQIIPEQNPVTFAGAFLSAGVQAIQSVQKGGNPMDVLKFMGLCGPAIRAHLERFSKDPTRHDVYAEIDKQWNALAKLVDQLKSAVQNQQKQQQEQQKKTQSAMSDQQISVAKAKADIQIKQAKTQAQIKQSQEKHQLANAQKVQQIKLADAKAAADIHISRLKSLQEIGA